MWCLRVLHLDCIQLVTECGRCCPCLERRAPFARVRSGDAAMGVCERYDPRDGLVYFEKCQWHLLQEFRNSESQCRPEVATFLLRKLFFLGLILVFSKSHFFATLVLCVFRKATFCCYFVFLCWGCVCYFIIFFQNLLCGHFLEEGRVLEGEVVPKLFLVVFSRCVVVCVFLFLAVWSECCLSMPLVAATWSDCCLSVLLFAKVWSECCLLVFFVDGVWALGGCRGLCRFPVRRCDWSSRNLSCAVWCVGAPPPQARGGLVCVWRCQEHFLHGGPSGMCRAMCRRVSGSNLQIRMVDNLSRMCDFAICFLQNYFLDFVFATFLLL